MNLYNQNKKLATMILVVLTLMSILFAPYNNASYEFLSKLSSWSSGIVGFFNQYSSMITKVSPYVNNGITFVEYNTIFEIAIIEFGESYVFFKNIVFYFSAVACLLCFVSLYFLYIEKAIAKLLLHTYFYMSVVHLLGCMFITPIFNDVITEASTSIINAGISGALSVGISGYLSCILSLGAIILWRTAKN